MHSHTHTQACPLARDTCAASYHILWGYKRSALNGTKHTLHLNTLKYFKLHSVAIEPTGRECQLLSQSMSNHFGRLGFEADASNSFARPPNSPPPQPSLANGPLTDRSNCAIDQSRSIGGTVGTCFEPSTGWMDRECIACVLNAFAECRHHSILPKHLSFGCPQPPFPIRPSCQAAMTVGE